jgi:hypothetical protein
MISRWMIRGVAFVLLCVGENVFAELSVDGPVSFGTVENNFGPAVSRSVTIYNKSDVATKIVDVRLGCGCLSLASKLPMIVEANSSAQLMIDLKPTSATTGRPTNLRGIVTDESGKSVALAIDYSLNPPVRTANLNNYAILVAAAGPGVPAGRPGSDILIECLESEVGNVTPILGEGLSGGQINWSDASPKQGFRSGSLVVWATDPSATRVDSHVELLVGDPAGRRGVRVSVQYSADAPAWAFPAGVVVPRSTGESFVDIRSTFAEATVGPIDGGGLGLTTLPKGDAPQAETIAVVKLAIPPESRGVTSGVASLRVKLSPTDLTYTIEIPWVVAD